MACVRLRALLALRQGSVAQMLVPRGSTDHRGSRRIAPPTSCVCARAAGAVRARRRVVALRIHVDVKASAVAMLVGSGVGCGYTRSSAESGHSKWCPGVRVVNRGI
jgi:hypothetical protein